MIINENSDKPETKKNKQLKRPFSTVNIIAPIKSFRNNIPENRKTIEKNYKKIPYENLSNIDLDQLYEKQLKKLREINLLINMKKRNQGLNIIIIYLIMKR